MANVLKPSFKKAYSGQADMETVKITIQDWQRFNPRPDLKSMSWFRMEVTIGFDRRLWRLRANQKWGWIVIISAASMDNTDSVELDIDHLCQECDCDTNEVFGLLDILQKYQMITYTRTNPNESERIRSEKIESDRKRVIRTNERTNETNERTNTLTRATHTCTHTPTRADVRDDPIEAETNVSVVPVGTDSELMTYDEKETKQEPPKTPAKQKPKLKFDDFDKHLAYRWLDWAKTQKPGKLNRAWTVDKFADGLNRTRRLAGLSEGDMEMAFAFIQHDEFWASNAISPCGLAKLGKNGNRKIENLLLKARQHPDVKQYKALKEFCEEPDDNDSDRIF